MSVEQTIGFSVWRYRKSTFYSEERTIVSYIAEISKELVQTFFLSYVAEKNGNGNNYKEIVPDVLVSGLACCLNIPTFIKISICLS